MARQSREPELFSAMYRDNRDDIYAFFRRRVDRESAQDCAAETFLIAWRRMNDVPEGPRARLWLFGVARNVLRKHYRSNLRDRRVAAAAAGSIGRPEAVEPTVERHLEDAELHNAMAGLRSRDRDLLMMVSWDELTHAEIGAILHCSPHAVDQRVHRALGRLRSALQSADHARSRSVARRRIEKGGAR